MKLLHTSPLVLVITIGLLAGCSSTSHVLVGAARPRIDPSLVRLYHQPPAKFEEIAILESDSNGSFKFSGQGKMDSVMERLKAEAASLGANGLIISGTGQMMAGSVGSGQAYSTGPGTATGYGFSGGIMIKTGHALAVYVPGTATNVSFTAPATQPPKKEQNHR